MAFAPLPMRGPIPTPRPTGGLLGTAPQGGLMGLLSDPEMRLMMGAAMMGGRDLGESLGNAFGVAGQMKAERRTRAEEEAKRNATLEFLRQQNPELAGAVEAGALTPGEAYKHHLSAKMPGKPQYTEVGGQLFNETTGEWLQPPGGGNDAQKRAAMAEQFGMSPDDPAYKAYVLTGKMPREDQAPLTATDKKAILEADEQVMANQGAINMLESVITPGADGVSLNDRAGSGATAGAQSWLARNDPTGFFDDTKGEATTELQNVVLNQALSTLKATFGAAPTEGERQILVDLQASVDKTPRERRAIIERGIALARKRLEFNERRAAEMRGGTYYKPGSGLPVSQPTPAGAFGAPTPPAGQRLRFNPATGELE